MPGMVGHEQGDQLLANLCRPWTALHACHGRACAAAGVQPRRLMCPSSTVEERAAF